jgi:pyrroline-5-carboxylate reductase
MKIGIAGCGEIARAHASIVKKHIGGASLVFCDRNPDKEPHPLG